MHLTHTIEFVVWPNYNDTVLEDWKPHIKWPAENNNTMIPDRKEPLRLDTEAIFPVGLEHADSFELYGKSLVGIGISAEHLYASQYEDTSTQCVG